MPANESHISSDHSPGEPGSPSAPLVRNAGERHRLETVLRETLAASVRAVEASVAFVAVLDEGNWPYRWFILHERRKDEFFSVPNAQAIVERGIVDRVIQHQHGVVVEEFSADPSWWEIGQLPIELSQGAALCLPLVIYQQVVAVLGLVHETPGYFQSQHLDILRDTVAPYIPSLEIARLDATVRRQAQEMAALSELGLNITADQPLDQLLNVVVAQAMDLLRCPGAGLFLWREEEGVLEMAAAYDEQVDLRGIRIAPGEGLVGCVFEAGEPLLWHARDGKPGLSPERLAADATSGLPGLAVAAVPLIWQGKPIGVLVTTDRTPQRRFDYHEQHLLMLLANHAATAIVSAELHEHTARRLQELTFLNQTIQDLTATLDLEEIFAVLTRRVKDMLRIEACSIALVDHQTNELIFHVASGGGAETVTGERVPWGQGIVGAAAQQGRAVNVANVDQDERFYGEIDKKQSDFVTRSILAVPMISSGQVVGVVEALNKPGGFDSEDARLLTALASLAASVVDNANLVLARRELEQMRENLTHMIVHDLRSPVGTISNSLELMGRMIENDEAQQALHLVGIANRANQRLRNLVDSLLDIGRLEAGQELTDLHPVSMRHLLQSALEQLSLYIERKEMQLEIQYPDHLPYVLADAGMIERVLVNLIGNALKFTPAEGQVQIAVTVEEDALHVHVSDTGPGIPREHWSTVFDKFARVRSQKRVEGIGLGLAFCRLAIEAHGGQIWIEAAQEHGTTFVFTLPLRSRPGHTKAASSQGRSE
jgi:K+-sensing histidine kinase KdpD